MCFIIIKYFFYISIGGNVVWVNFLPVTRGKCLKTTKTIILLVILTIFSTFTLGALFAYSVDSEHGHLVVKEQVKESNRDVEITREFEEAIKTDDKLASSAHAIKITEHKNFIVLEGHVNSKQQKFKAGHVARTMAGERRVYNKLTY